MSAIKLDKFQQHLLLYCKGQYSVEGVDFITGIQRIWAVRCGIDVEHIENSINEYIADALVEIILKVSPREPVEVMKIVHKDLQGVLMSQYKELPTIDKLLMVYRGIIISLQVAEKVGDSYVPLVSLPKPQPNLFSRIITGGGKYGDYTYVKGAETA